MTPYEIGILMHYACSPTDYEGRGEPILRGTLEAFVEQGLLQRSTFTPDDGSRPPMFEATERTRAYVESLRQVPLPVQRWVTEWPEQRT